MYNIKKHKISDNITLYIIQDKKYKTLYASTFLHRQLLREETTKNALLAKVLKSGTAKHPSMEELSIYAEELFGCSYDVGITKRANIQSIVSSISVIQDKFAEKPILEKSLELMLDLLFKPNIKHNAFLDEMVANQKKNLKDDIQSLINDKRAYANVRCMEEMCKGEQNAVVEIGYIEDIDKIQSTELYRHYQSIICSSPIDIFIVGDVEEGTLCNFLHDYFSDYTFIASPVNINFSHKQPKKIKYIEDKLEVNQGKLAIGLRTGINLENPMYYALLTGNSIFGSGAHSKLFNNVREKLSLCYYAYSRLDKYNSLMIVGSGIEFENYEKTRDAVLTELENVQKGNFTDEELAISKEYIISSYVSYADNPGILIDYYIGMSFTDKLLPLDEAVKKVASVTREDVIEAFQNVQTDTVYFLNGKEQR